MSPHSTDAWQCSPGLPSLALHIHHLIARVHGPLARPRRSRLFVVDSYPPAVGACHAKDTFVLQIDHYPTPFQCPLHPLQPRAVPTIHRSRRLTHFVVPPPPPCSASPRWSFPSPFPPTCIRHATVGATATAIAAEVTGAGATGP